MALYNREIVAALRDATIAARLEQLGFIITATTADEMKAQVLADQKRFKPLVEAAGLAGMKQ